MTPSARLQAAIEILDQYLSGTPVEKALTNWARRSRFAGSKDRAAVRDIVFQSVRCRLSYADFGGGETGRALGIGYVNASPDHDFDLFDGSGYGPDALSDYEKNVIKSNKLSGKAHVNLDIPEWLLGRLTKALGDTLGPVMTRLQTRASVFVRVNGTKGSIEDAQMILAEDGIDTTPHPLAASALEVTSNQRKLKNSKALQSGLVDLQDVASQAVCATINLENTARILDYCAGGGGKALALADRSKADVYAYDVNFSRMQDIPARAKRAGVRVERLKEGDIAGKGPFDVLLCDVPCSGSGAWRRSPEGKWELTAETLAALLETQAQILNKSVEYVARGGTLVYATCSMLCEENEDQIERFLSEKSEWTQSFSRRFSPMEGGDGFFVAHLTRRA